MPNLLDRSQGQPSIVKSWYYSTCSPVGSPQRSQGSLECGLGREDLEGRETKEVRTVKRGAIVDDSLNPQSDFSHLVDSYLKAKPQLRCTLDI